MASTTAVADSSGQSDECGEDPGVRAMKNKLPERWVEYTAVGNRVPGTRFIAFKVPLKKLYDNQLAPWQRFTISDLVKEVEERNEELGLVVDLTCTNRYYDPKEWPATIKYSKMYVAGHLLPSDELIADFKRIVKKFLEENSDNDKLIGVHCTHGLNRSGYMVCRFMIDVLGAVPLDAIDKFNRSRGHHIERQNYLDDLLLGFSRNNVAPVRPPGEMTGIEMIMARQRATVPNYQMPRHQMPMVGHQVPMAGHPMFGHQIPMTGHPMFGHQLPMFGHQIRMAGHPMFGHQMPISEDEQPEEENEQPLVISQMPLHGFLPPTFNPDPESTTHPPTLGIPMLDPAVLGHQFPDFPHLPSYTIPEHAQHQQILRQQVQQLRQLQHFPQMEGPINAGGQQPNFLAPHLIGPFIRQPHYSGPVHGPYVRWPMQDRRGVPRQQWQ